MFNVYKINLDMKKVIMSLALCVAFLASSSMIAQDNKDAKKEKTEKTCCSKDKKASDKKDANKKCDKKSGEKKSCCKAKSEEKK